MLGGYDVLIGIMWWVTAVGGDDMLREKYWW